MITRTNELTVTLTDSTQTELRIYKVDNSVDECILQLDDPSGTMYFTFKTSEAEDIIQAIHDVFLKP